jgi:hypothetical protein
MASEKDDVLLDIFFQGVVVACEIVLGAGSGPVRSLFRVRYLCGSRMLWFDVCDVVIAMCLLVRFVDNTGMYKLCIPLDSYI